MKKLHLFLMLVVAGFLVIGIAALIAMEERPLRSTIFATPSRREISPERVE